MPFKDLPEGKTHYQNDGCGMPEHNQPEDRVIIDFVLQCAPNCWDKDDFEDKEGKEQFISDLTEMLRAREHSLLSIIKSKVGWMMKVCKTCKKPLDETARDYDGIANCQCCDSEKFAYEHTTDEIGFNEALKQLINLIEKYEK